MEKSTGFPGLPGHRLHAALWGEGAGFSFPRMPSSHFSYWRETWLNFPAVNICDVKSAENMSLSGLILAGFYEIAEDSQSSARIPCTGQACVERSGITGVDSRLCLPGQEWKIPGWGGGGGGREQWPKSKGTRVMFNNVS